MSMLFAEDSVAPMEIEGASDEEQTSSQQQQQQGRRQSFEEEEEEEKQEEEEEEQKTNDDDEAIDDDGEGADLDVDEATRLELADQQRKKERLRKQQTRHELKIFNETMAQPDIQKAVLQQSHGLKRAATKLESIARHIGVKDVSNSLLDARGLEKLSHLGQKKAAQLTSMTTIDTDELMNKFQSRYSVEEDGQFVGIDWHRFGREIAHNFRAVDCTSFMKGLLGLQFAVKEKRQTQRRKRVDSDDDAPLVRAEQLLDTSKETASMTDKRVTLLYHHLPTIPTNLFTVLMHPTCFTQSVENLFDLTFLIKKGQAEVKLDEEVGLPFVRKLADVDPSKDESDDNGDGSSDQATFQCIMKLDKLLWQQLVTAFKITRSFLPDRSKEYEKRNGVVQSRSQSNSNTARRSSSSGSKRRVESAGPEFGQSDDEGGGGESEYENVNELLPDHFTPSQQTLAGMIRAKKKSRPGE